MSFIARYDSRCALCVDEIVADVDEIMRTPDGYAHVKCGENDRELGGRVTLPL